MATVYKVEVVSHWINYSEEQIKEMIESAIKDKERDKGNTVQIRVQKR